MKFLSKTVIYLITIGSFISCSVGSNGSKHNYYGPGGYWGDDGYYYRKDVSYHYDNGHPYFYDNNKRKIYIEKRSTSGRNKIHNFQNPEIKYHNNKNKSHSNRGFDNASKR